jgi:hypothetical protein
VSTTFVPDCVAARFSGGFGSVAIDETMYPVAPLEGSTVITEAAPALSRHCDAK